MEPEPPPESPIGSSARSPRSARPLARRMPRQRATAPVAWPRGDGPRGDGSGGPGHGATEAVCVL